MIARFNILMLGLLSSQACSTENISYNPHSGGSPQISTGIEAEIEGGYKLHWHFPCESQELTHTGEYDFFGAGHNWLNIQTIQKLQLNISGRACDHDAARNTVFILDVSGSMQTNDPPRNGGCARYSTLKTLAAKLYRSESLNLGVMLFSGTASCLKLTDNGINFSSCQSTSLISAQDFKSIVDNHSDALKRKVCQNGGGTSYGQAFSAAEGLLRRVGGEGHSNEVYFFSDGMPNFASAAKSGSEKLRKHAFIATVGFGQTGPILRQHVASKVRGNPAHRQANKIDDLSTYFSELLDINHAIGKLEWERYGVDASKDTIELNEFIKDDGSFILNPITFDVSEPLDAKTPSGILLKLSIQPGFSKNSEYLIDADLRFE